ncbi:hypothetical protein I4970_17880 [Pseudomonas aeruginosa]|uniref:hypothetical protein n=1 Tax=Pseudomonas aeruginosa TaxID=287 RepID=UPI0018C51E17|nr:hypothetical protein [Pseudomonas aeruginosa]EIU7092181.1 hypothetical protein [Pseudomonas aeruginosa]MBG5268045.1 hypothetical protein [Pseudomonas aeruginosa]MBR7580126.1 hypothetical protein [Pseudomonas aeruginosa]HBO2682087.1 hypothetical protein [Pseudomonas aeruginosa]HEJ6215588.1 hypothetical protein [Pseudomonas aeruginosa]
MIGDFLAQVQGLVSFANENGVPPRRTPFGFLMPDYRQDEAGLDRWEAAYGEKARGTTRLPAPVPKTVRNAPKRTVQQPGTLIRQGRLE